MAPTGAVGLATSRRGPACKWEEAAQKMRGGGEQRGRSQPPKKVTVTTTPCRHSSRDPGDSRAWITTSNLSNPKGKTGQGWVSFHFADEKGGPRGGDPHPHHTARCEMRPTWGLPSWPRALTDHLNKCLGAPVRGPRTSVITKPHPDKSTRPHTTRAGWSPGCGQVWSQRGPDLATV